MKSKWIAPILIAAAGIARLSSADIVWPADGAWQELKIGANKYFDTRGDQSPSSIDLIGDAASYSAGFFSLVENGDITGGVTNDAFMFRMRVGGESGNYVWQAHLDTDGDSSNVEYIFQLVQSGNPGSQGVKLIKTTVGGTTLGDIAVDSKAAADWSGSLTLYSRWTAVPGSATDFYVDFAIPWSEFTAITGVSSLQEIRAVLATSSTHAGINKDAPLGGSLSTQISDALSASIPEPTVVTLLLGAGGGILASRRIFKRKPEDEDEQQR
ncbi:MAG: hypothetical protein K9M54_01355 [Kiritimatiellales bacterium]|nr:hypothetical protein [Kiritimatiellales bacterium]